MILKRAASVVSALAFVSLPLFMIQPVMASATDTTLSPAQTRALLGDTILGSRITGGGQNDLAIATFEFYSYGTVSLQNTVGTRYDTPSGQANTYTNWNCVGSECVIYRSSDTFIDGSTTNYANHYTVHLNLSTSLYGLSSCRFAYGFSNNEGIMNTSVSRYGNGGIPFINSYVHTVYANSTEEKQYVGYATNGTWSYYNNMGVICDDPNENQLNCTNIQFKKESLSTDILIDNMGVQQCDRVQHPGIGTNSTGFNNYTYFVVVCPQLSDTWYDPNAGGGDDSGGGDSGSGTTPDYSGDLQAIIDRLDVLIANSQDRFSQLYNINAGINNTNSKLDQVNSNLNKIDSHLDRIGADLSSLYYPSSGDTSKVNNYNSQFSAEWSQAHQDHQYLDSISRNADVSLPSLDNQYSMPDDFGQLWNYTDRDGFTWPNYILIGMPVLTLTVGILSYIIFGKAK